jgi:hypothetical protein
MGEEINTTPVGRSSNNQQMRTLLAEALWCLVYGQGPTEHVALSRHDSAGYLEFR